MMRVRIKRIFELGIINTMRINYHYFGMRGIFYPLILCSKNVRLEYLAGGVLCKNPSFCCVKIGFKEIDVFDSKSESSAWQNRGKIVFEGRARFGSGSRIANSGVLEIGDNVSISGNSTIICEKYIKLGKDALISWDCLFMDTDLHKVINAKEEIINNPDDIIVGEHVWFGTRCCVLKGTKVLNNTVVAAGSVLTKKITESDCLIVSNKVVKREINWVK